MPTDGTGIKARVDQIIADRRAMLPNVQAQLQGVARRRDSVTTLRSLLQRLEDSEEDPDSQLQIKDMLGRLDAGLAELDDHHQTLLALQRRFSRDTVNIGVSGEARVGKSTTLQNISGLTDTQIPTGDGLPVTAVRSEIYNSDDEYALVSFHTDTEFLRDYIQPLITTVNAALDLQKEPHQPLTITSLEDFRTLEIPKKLGNNIDSVSSDSLRRLTDAQLSLATYESLLSQAPTKIPLKDLRRYVAYPTNEEIKAETPDQPADRAFIAVKAVKIYCSFPSLPGIKLGLVDLPGLGEIGTSVADMHLSGLEDGIDQIIPIMRPIAAEGYLKRGIAENIDQLRRIQRGITNRGDLITAAINVYDGAEDTAQTLYDDFQRTVNSAQTSDHIDVLHYSAIDSSRVASLFSSILEKVALRLPQMDQQVFNYALDEIRNASSLTQSLADLDNLMNALLRRIPLPDKLLNDHIDTICRAIIHGLNRYEVELIQTIGQPSEWYQRFDINVQSIHKQVAAELDSGFFLGKSQWHKRARGRVDYYNWYREEAKRIRREIIDRYSQTDEFYSSELTQFKEKILRTFLKPTGELAQKFGLHTAETPNARIEKLASQLASAVPNEDIEAAFALLKGVEFSFRNNVFLQISGHLDELANPEELLQLGDTKVRENKRRTLSKVGDIDKKISKVREYLANDAVSANDNIRDALLQHEDRFHEYLYVSLSFFLDYLYRKDEENFKHTFVRSLVNKYRSAILGADASITIDQSKKALLEQIKATIPAARVNS